MSSGVKSTSSLLQHYPKIDKNTHLRYKLVRFSVQTIPKVAKNSANRQNVLKIHVRELISKNSSLPLVSNQPAVKGRKNFYVRNRLLFRLSAKMEVNKQF